MRYLTLLFLLGSACANAGNLWYRAHDADSVIIGPICTYASADGVSRADIDFNTSSLTITIYASGDGVDTSYTYTGANIDDYDGTPPAWGNPTTSAVEVEDDDECIRLHIRDEVLAVTNATEWTITIDDASTTIMDWEGQILALADSTDNQADVNAALVALQLDHLMNQAVVGTDVTDNSVVAQLASKSATADWDSFDNETDSLEGHRDLTSSVSTKMDTAQLDLNDLTDGFILIDGTATSGTTGTLADTSALTQADDYWNNWAAVVVAGYAPRCIRDFDATTDTITFYPVLPSAVSTDEYVIVSAPSCRSFP